jgi:hypothetical protein
MEGTEKMMRSKAPIFEVKETEPKTTGVSPPVMIGVVETPENPRKTQREQDIEAILCIADGTLGVRFITDDICENMDYQSPSKPEHYAYGIASKINDIIGDSSNPVSLMEYDIDDLLWIIEGSKYLGMLKALGVKPEHPPPQYDYDDDEDDDDEY